MSQSFVVWDNKTHSRDKHLSDVHASAVIGALEREGMGCEGKVFPVAAMVVPDDIRFVAQDSLGYWWTFTHAPVEAPEGCWMSPDGDEGYVHTSSIGWWTNKMYRL